MAKTNGQCPFGYKHGLDGFYEIVESSAAVIKRIFNDYLNKVSVRQITKNLNSEGIKSSRGVKWDHSMVCYILRNKKYCGSVNYKAIINEEIFLKVQVLRENGVERYKYPYEVNCERRYRYPFSSKIMCGECGGQFNRAVVSSGRPWKKYVWRCKRYVVNGKVECRNPEIPELILKEMFVKAFNEIQTNKDKYLKVIQYKNSIIKPHRELETLFDESIEMLRKASIDRCDDIEEVNASTAIILQKRISKIWKQIGFDEGYYNNQKLEGILNDPPYMLTEFKEEIFKKTIERIIGLRPGVVQFQFINGVIIEETYETEAVRKRRDADDKKYDHNSSQVDPRS